MKEFAKAIEDHKKGKMSQIYGSFKKATVAKPITKAEFDAEYPSDKFEYYTAANLDKFRQDIIKAEEIVDKDDAFKKATEDLKPHVVHADGQKVILFTREKQKGE